MICTGGDRLSNELANILKQAERLSDDEQLLLIARLAEHNRSRLLSGAPRRTWTEVRGAATDVDRGEDAQAWVSRTRNEADANRPKASPERE
jgi:hypothetical protein